MGNIPFVSWSAAPPPPSATSDVPTAPLNGANTVDDGDDGRGASTKQEHTSCPISNVTPDSAVSNSAALHVEIPVDEQRTQAPDTQEEAGDTQELVDERGIDPDEIQCVIVQVQALDWAVCGCVS
jgi:hypothetical protein